MIYFYLYCITGSCPSCNLRQKSKSYHFLRLGDDSKTFLLLVGHFVGFMAAGKPLGDGKLAGGIKMI